MLMSKTRREALTPNPNECNSTLTSGTNNIYPYPHIIVTAYELPTRVDDLVGAAEFIIKLKQKKGKALQVLPLEM